MKLQCELCKEIVVADFALAAAAIEVFCSACGQSFTATPTRGDAAPVEPAASRPVRRGPPDGEPAMCCPKCDDAQPPGAACRSCGLLAARFGDFSRDRDAGVPPEVAAAWQRVEDAWADDAAHEAFLRTVAAALAFPWAALRYREALRLRPDDAGAAARLARVARMAEATLMAASVRKPDPEVGKYRNATTLLVALVALLLVGVGYAVIASRLRDHEAAPQVSPTRPAVPAKAKVKPKPRPDVRP